MQFRLSELWETTVKMSLQCIISQLVSFRMKRFNTFCRDIQRMAPSFCSARESKATLYCLSRRSSWDGGEEEEEGEEEAEEAEDEEE